VFASNGVATAAPAAVRPAPRSCRRDSRCAMVLLLGDR
jgi:hypothetical protein